MGTCRAASAVRAPEYALHEAAGAAARLLQPEQGGRSHLADQQRHRQAEPVLRAEPRAAGGKPVHDDRRRDLSTRAPRPPRHRGAGAGARRAAIDARHRPLGEAKEHQEPAIDRRPERRDSGEPRPTSRSSSPSTASTISGRSSTRPTSATTPHPSASGIVSNIFMPIYGLAYNLAQILVLLYGIHLVAIGSATVGLLIGFLLYVNSFYMPMRQLAVVWSSFQLALAGLDRISEVLALESNLPVLPRATVESGRALLEFDQVGFSYPGSQRSPSRRRRSRSSAARPTRSSDRPAAARPRPPSLMARLYDPTRGRVLLDGRDIRTCTPEERTPRDRLHPSGALPLHRHHPRQHRLRPQRNTPATRTSS